MLTSGWFRRRACRAGDGLALLGLAVLALLFFWPVTFRAGWIPRGGGDLVSFLWPTYSYAARALHAGRLPLWNETLYSGAPFAADNQSGLFYPVNLVAFALWPSLPYAVMEWLVVGHVWLAGAGMYALVRALAPPPAGRASLPAVFAAVAYMFSDVFVTHVGNLNIVAVSAWLPLSFLALHLAIQRGSAAWAAAAGLVLGVAALAGHAQMTLIVVLAAAAYGAWSAASALRVSRRAAVARLARLVLALVVALGLATVSLLPAVELARHTGRATLSYAAASEYSLPWAGLAGLLSPLVFGRGAAGFWAPWDRVEAGYAGVLTLFLAGLAPFRARRGLVTFLALLAAFGLLVALGTNTPLHRLLYLAVPGFAQLRVPARFVLLTDFSLAVLAGLGLQRLPQVPPRRAFAWGLALLTGGLVVCAAAFASVPGAAAHSRDLAAGLALFAVLVLAGLALLWPRLRPAAGGLAVALLALDLFALGAWVEVERQDPTLGFDHPAVANYLAQQPGPVRIDNASAAWAPDAAARYGLEDVGGIFNPLGLADYQTYLGAVGSRGTALYNFLNAQFVIADKGQPPGDSSLVPVFDQDPQLDVYLNTGAQPRVRLADQARLAPSGEAAFGLIHAPDFDPATQVVLDASASTTPLPIPAVQRVPPGLNNLYYLSYHPEAYSLVVETVADNYVVFSEVYYPGWHAYLDGAEVPIYKANFAFRAVYVPAGQHVVDVRFEPASFKLGLALTALTVLALGAWAGQRLYIQRATRRSLVPEQPPT